MENRTQAGSETPARYRAQIGVECPQCHFRQFVVVDSELVETLLDSKAAKKVHAELVAWMGSHCPEHLRSISLLSRN